MVLNIYNPDTQEAEARESQVSGQPGLHSEFKDSLNSIVRLRIIKQKAVNSGRLKVNLY
jgi:hypothetical protein